MHEEAMPPAKAVQPCVTNLILGKPEFDQICERPRGVGKDCKQLATDGVEAKVDFAFRSKPELPQVDQVCLILVLLFVVLLFVVSRGEPSCGQPFKWPISAQPRAKVSTLRCRQSTRLRPHVRPHVQRWHRWNLREAHAQVGADISLAHLFGTLQSRREGQAEVSAAAR